uniref:Uncharacterized protein n=1 Tax=Parascaris equorum TaxID=6256 RepID=A0A914S083_PAREQ
MIAFGLSTFILYHLVSIPWPFYSGPLDYVPLGLFSCIITYSTHLFFPTCAPPMVTISSQSDITLGRVAVRKDIFRAFPVDGSVLVPSCARFDIILAAVSDI